MNRVLSVAYATHRFVDGRDYFAEVCRAIEGAKEDIFIADWWLSPEIVWFHKRAL